MYLIGAGLLLVLLFFFVFSNKPPKESVYTILSEKLLDSLELSNEQKIVSLQKEVKKSSGEKKASVYNELAKEWIDAGYYNIAGDYMRQKADAAPDYENYYTAGTFLFGALDTDTSQQMRMNIVYGSRYCFEKALELKPGDINAKISLANVIVQGTSNPMEGITLLREVVAEEPGNVEANLLLGNFSMMSGQYDKALERFRTVLEKDSLNLQARYLMAQSYLGVLDTAGAIRTLETATQLVQDTLVVNRIRKDINSLKNN